MKKLLFVFSGLLLFSCTEDDINAEQDYSQGAKIVGFEKSFESIAYFEDLGQIEKSFAVNYIGLGNGKTSDTDIELSYEVDLVNSTASEGVEFNFVGSSNKITIPSGGTFAALPLLINTGQLNPTEKTELVLKLTSSNQDVVVGEQYKSIKIIFVGCETHLEGTYKRGAITANVTKVAPNVYRSSYLPDFASIYWFEFADVCGELSIVDWQFQGGNPISSLNSEDGLVKGFITDNNDLTFEDAYVRGVDWYVGLTWTLVKQ